MCVCAPVRSKNLQSKKIDRVESAPIDVYGLENLTTVTYVCMLIMPEPWLNCSHEETRVLATTKHNTVSCSADDQHWSHGPLSNGPRMIYFSYHNSHVSKLFVKRCSNVTVGMNVKK